MYIVAQGTLAYSLAMAACVKGGQGELALRLFDEMRRRVTFILLLQ